MSLLHEQYEIDGDLVVFRCSECGYASLSPVLPAGIHDAIPGVGGRNITLWLVFL